MSAPWHIAALAGLAAPALAMAEIEVTPEEPLILPSGLEAELQEMIWDRPGGGLVYRFRFVAPGFTGVDDMSVVMADLEYLCNTFAVPRLANTGPQPGKIVVSLADQPSEFGIFDPDITQIFEAYSVKDGVCIWEMF